MLLYQRSVFHSCYDIAVKFDRTEFDKLKVRCAKLVGKIASQPERSRVNFVASYDSEFLGRNQYFITSNCKAYTICISVDIVNSVNINVESCKSNCKAIIELHTNCPRAIFLKRTFQVNGFV
ncbi:MAG: hypothetical protein EZS28_038666 [Streblomastix strix]|uniref:Uncharacterized protein n=1 Tax=Streblomastix strix TaxID=222440 RepID=A0A5J4U5F0_9EUKA|nr:MAG: hypothetical protein EZS28_038666 [Streblomastix strix]